jgi:hypothetical protein
MYLSSSEELCPGFGLSCCLSVVLVWVSFGLGRSLGLDLNFVSQTEISCPKI